MGLGEQDQLAIDQLARRYAEELLAPGELDDDRYPFAPWNRGAWACAAELGLPGLALPATCGGTEQGLEAFARMLEIVARWEAGAATLLLTQALARTVIVSGRSQELTRRWATLRGDANENVLAFPLYDDPEEPAATLRATRGEAGFVLEGELPQLACLPVAQACVVPAVLTESGERAWFVVDVTARGVQVSEPVVTLGLRGCPTGDLVLSAVQVDADARIGDASSEPVSEIVERFRPALVALALGVLRASYELAFAYARERKQAKQRIVQHHMVQELLSGMACTLDVGGLALARAYQLLERGRLQGTELLSLQETLSMWVTRAATDGVQVLGGNGYMHDYGQEKHMRDAKQLQAVFGCSPTRRLRVLERRLLAAS